MAMLLQALLLVILSSIHASSSSNIIKSLPGFLGDLPFKLETGYVGVGDLDEVQLFYYFIESEATPKYDPLVLWLTGGPGCSAVTGLVYEIGPLSFDYAASIGNKPKLKLNPYSWTKVANIIFLDAPVGTGFSYAKTWEGYSNLNDTISAAGTYEFLRKWLMDHPKFLNNPLYIAGDSYSGIVVPLIVQKISDGTLVTDFDLSSASATKMRERVNHATFNSIPTVNDIEKSVIDLFTKGKGNQDEQTPRMNFKGYVLGNPVTADEIDVNSRVLCAYLKALISEELYLSLKRNCKGDYINVDQNNTLCVDDLEIYNECMEDINAPQILEPICAFDTLKSKESNWPANDLSKKDSVNLLLSFPQLSRPWCRDYTYVFSEIWANDKTVQNALHVRVGSIEDWERCNKTLQGHINYTPDVSSSVVYHENLIKQGYRVLIYSGDHDLMRPYVGTMAWIESLNLTVDSRWKPWFVNGQVAGYRVLYKHNKYQLTYTTIKGGGHTAPEYNPEECLAMISRWFAYYPL